MSESGERSVQDVALIVGGGPESVRVARNCFLRTVCLSQWRPGIPTNRRYRASRRRHSRPGKE
jgi:hypothetical protein